MRALSCFGGGVIHIIGKVPKASELKRLSGSHSDLIKIVHHKRPEDFIVWARTNDWKIISAELTEGAIDFNCIKFDPNLKYVIAVGNEMNGVPQDVIKASQIVTFIPMIGLGFCLNTSQTANIMLYEYAKQRAYLNNL